VRRPRAERVNGNSSSALAESWFLFRPAVAAFLPMALVCLGLFVRISIEVGKVLVRYFFKVRLRFRTYAMDLVVVGCSANMLLSHLLPLSCIEQGSRRITDEIGKGWRI
jgi:hypothetical protein